MTQICLIRFLELTVGMFQFVTWCHMGQVNGYGDLQRINL